MSAGFWCRALVLLALVAAGPAWAARPTDPAPDPTPSLAGRFLVATDSLEGPVFGRTVILLLEHDAGGAMGLIVNKLVGQAAMGDFLAAMGIEGKDAQGVMRIHSGGPVGLSRGFLVHSPDYRGRSTQVLGGAVAVTPERDVLEALGRGEGPARHIFVFGYAGWGPSQLESEIERGSWDNVPADPEIIFDDGDNLAGKWRRAREKGTGTR